MKKMAILSMVSLSLFLSVSFAQNVKVKEDKMKVKGDGKMASLNTGNYKATYSANFQIGNSSYAQKIMEMWQDWDDNMLDRHDYMSDTLTMYFADGTSMKGKAENLSEAKKYRGKFTSVKSTLHAIVPLKSNDQGDDVVCVWGEEADTLPDGKVEKKSIHEVWFFNKDGKITAMRQWHADVK
jgi:hypothetical protein